MRGDISNPTPTHTTTFNHGVVAAMAFATGAVIANLYYIQPLAETLAQEFNVSSSAVGMIITLFSVGHAIGLAALVPLGDLLERRCLLATMLGSTVIGLAVMALAPSLIVLGMAAAVVGLTSVATHVIVPLAAQLAARDRQGRVISAVMSGLLLGILLSARFLDSWPRWRVGGPCSGSPRWLPLGRRSCCGCNCPRSPPLPGCATRRCWLSCYRWFVRSRCYGCGYSTARWYSIRTARSGPALVSCLLAHHTDGITHKLARSLYLARLARWR